MQRARGDLPGQAPFILAPPALTLGAAVADDRIPVAIGLGLILGEDLKRKGFAVLESRAAVQAEAGHTQHRELDRENLALLSIREIAGGAWPRSTALSGKVWA